jgi:hypothetical protein
MQVQQGKDCLAGIPACQDQKLSRLDRFGPIKLEKVFGHSAGGGQWDDAAAVEPEVPRPFIRSRVEQRDDLTSFDVDRGNVASLKIVASKTAPGEVSLPGLTAVFAGHDMVYLMREQRVILVD